MAERKSACCCDVTGWLKMEAGCCDEKRLERLDGCGGGTGNRDDDEAGFEFRSSGSFFFGWCINKWPDCAAANIRCLKLCLCKGLGLKSV